MPPPLPRDPAALNARAQDYLPGRLGIEFLQAEPEAVSGRLPVSKAVMAPNGYLHAASVIALVDTLAGFGTMLNLPDGAQAFTTIELKSNFTGTVRAGGAVLGRATPAHLGRTTQVWDAVASDEATGKTVALFRCTQMILWPKEG
ncbi:MAG: PaaI family thioesterase [Rhodospirillales bacterium]